jgi:hypothetical protein
MHPGVQKVYNPVNRMKMRHNFSTAMHILRQSIAGNQAVNADHSILKCSRKFGKFSLIVSEILFLLAFSGGPY